MQVKLRATAPERWKSYRNGLAIADGLAKTAPSNAAWRSLSVSHGRVGDMGGR